MRKKQNSKIIENKLLKFVSDLCYNLNLVFLFKKYIKLN